MKIATILFFIGAVMVFGVFSAEAAPSLGDPFDGNSLKNPNWKWKTSDEAGVEPKIGIWVKRKPDGFTSPVN